MSQQGSGQKVTDIAMVTERNFGLVSMCMQVGACDDDAVMLTSRARWTRRSRVGWDSRTPRARKPVL